MTIFTIIKVYDNVENFVVPSDTADNLPNFISIESHHQNLTRHPSSIYYLVIIIFILFNHF